MHGKSFPVNQLVVTSGGGLWSNVISKVLVTNIDIMYYNQDDLDDDDNKSASKFLSIDVYFDTSTWDTYNNGLIYTDAGFRNEINDILIAALNTKDFILSYSEQGMQGQDYVNFDLELTSDFAFNQVVNL